MHKRTIVKEAEKYVKQKLGNDSSGHDWWHIHRVRKLATQMATLEGADPFICELTALLHDLADEKLFQDEMDGLKTIRCWLSEHGVIDKDANHIISIIENMSFKGGNMEPLKTLEGKVVQDADRIDAIGAVGIARTFAYAGAKGELMYDPNISVRKNMSKEEYRNGKSTAINHFYEKLLKLKDKMNTKTGKEIAKKRHHYLEQYLEQFFHEWNGNS